MIQLLLSLMLFITALAVLFFTTWAESHLTRAPNESPASVPAIPADPLTAQRP